MVILVHLLPSQGTGDPLDFHISAGHGISIPMLFARSVFYGKLVGVKNCQPPGNFIVRLFQAEKPHQ